jgi:hypothetical protein
MSETATEDRPESRNERLFYATMLKHDCRISKDMKGIAPDGTDEERTAGEAAWFKARPVITKEERENTGPPPEN